MNEDTTTKPAEQPRRYSFFGSYAHSIDSKGRLIIPNAYREALGECFSMGPTRDFQGIALYPDPVFDKMLDEIAALNPRKPIVQKYASEFYKYSYRDIQPDAQGRILLPTKLRQWMLGEAKELEVSGGFDHVRIVDSVKGSEEDLSFRENLDDILDQIGNMDE